MANVKIEKSGKVLMSELSHLMAFLTAMGFDVESLPVYKALSIKEKILNGIQSEIGVATLEVKDPFN